MINSLFLKYVSKKSSLCGPRNTDCNNCDLTRLLPHTIDSFILKHQFFNEFKERISGEWHGIFFCEKVIYGCYVSHMFLRHIISINATKKIELCTFVAKYRGLFELFRNGYNTFLQEMKSISL